jgi:predicted DNA-binding transcriptional regulator AlpA
MTRTAFTIDEWAEMNGVSRGHFYNLKKIGKAPRSFKAGTRHLISAEADVQWRREREAEAAAKTRAA